MDRNVRRNRWTVGIATVAVLAALLSACSTSAAPQSSTGSSSTGAATATPRPAATTQPTEKAAATQEPQPAAPTEAAMADSEVVAQAQDLGLGDTLTVKSVSAIEKGWITINADDNGKPGAVIGYIAVPKDKSENVVVHIDKSKATHMVYAVLHVDAGKDGVFEFPGADVEARNTANEVVMASFAINNLAN